MRAAVEPCGGGHSALWMAMEKKSEEMRIGWSGKASKWAQAHYYGIPNCCDGLARCSLGSMSVQRPMVTFNERRTGLTIAPRLPHNQSKKQAVAFDSPKGDHVQLVLKHKPM